MKYEIRATFTVEAESKTEALSHIAACVLHWEEETGIDNIQGVGGATGYVTIEEA